jgi:putative ABC transport system permease protein
VWAAARAAGQLLLVGAALQLVVNPDASLVWSWLWVIVMIAFAAWTSRRRAPEVPRAGWLSAIAYTAATVIALGILFGLGVFPLSATTLVPLAGMIVGNSLSATVLVGRRIIAEFRDKRDQVEARLALGQPSAVAARPYLRTAVRDALIPQIETTKAVGIVFLPGAMVGLLLAGVDPLDAVKVQAAVMYLVLGSVATTTTVIAIGLTRRLFTHTTGSPSPQAAEGPSTGNIKHRGDHIPAGYGVGSPRRCAGVIEQVSHELAGKVRRARVAGSR